VTGVGEQDAVPADLLVGQLGRQVVIDGAVVSHSGGTGGGGGGGGCNAPSTTV